MDEHLFTTWTVGTDGRGKVLIGSADKTTYVILPTVALQAAIALINKANEAIEEGLKTT